MEHFDGLLRNLLRRNKEASKLVNALAVPYVEVFYEDLLLETDAALLKVETFLDVGAQRIAREVSIACSLCGRPALALVIGRALPRSVFVCFLASEIKSPLFTSARSNRFTAHLCVCAPAWRAPARVPCAHNSRALGNHQADATRPVPCRGKLRALLPNLL